MKYKQAMQTKIQSRIRARSFDCPNALLKQIVGELEHGLEGVSKGFFPWFAEEFSA